VQVKRTTMAKQACNDRRVRFSVPGLVPALGLALVPGLAPVPAPAQTQPAQPRL